MTRDPLRRPAPHDASRTPTPQLLPEITAAAAGVKATVWPRTGIEGGEPTPLACVMFIDEADAYEFLRRQMFTLPARRVDQVRVRLAGAAGTTPRRELVGTAASLLASLYADPAETQTADDGAPESLPHNEKRAPQGDASAQLPLAARTVPVALHPRTLDQQLADYGIREMWMRERTELRHLMSLPTLMNIERNTLGRERNAIDELDDADTDQYLRAWTAAATEQARRMGLTDTVPVLVSTLPTEYFDDTDLEPIYDHAFAVTPLPGCSYIPQTFPHCSPDGALDIDAFIAAEHAAGRGYRDRVRARVEAADAGQAPVV